MRNYMILALIFLSFSSYSQKNEKPTVDGSIPSQKKLREIFQCNDLSLEDVSSYYVHGDTFELRKKNGAWGISANGHVVWKHNNVGYITTLVSCDTTQPITSAGFPEKYTIIFSNCDSSMILLEEYGAIYLAEEKQGTTYLIEVCDTDLNTMVGFGIECIRPSNEDEKKEYFSTTGEEVVSAYTIVSKYGKKNRKDKLLFSWRRGVISLFGVN